MSKGINEELARLSELIDLIYQGISDVNVWQRTATEISDYLESSTGLIFTPLHCHEDVGFTVVEKFPEHKWELFVSKYHHYDIWSQNIVMKGLDVTGNVIRDQEMVDEELFLSSTIYQEYLSTINIGRLLTGVIFSSADNSGIPIAVSCHRPFENPFTQEDKDKLGLLMPHLSRALGVMFKLRDAEFKVATSLAALDRLPNGVILFDSEGAVMFHNGPCGRMLILEDGLRLRKRPGLKASFDLLAETRLDQEALDEAIHEAISPDILTTAHFSRALAIHKPSGKNPYTLNFSSLSQKNEFGVGGESPRAIAFLNDNANPVKLNVDLLKATYALTTAEIRIAELLVEGLMNGEIAERLDLSINTIKTQIRQIHEKTNASNRTKLVRLLLSLATT